MYQLMEAHAGLLVGSVSPLHVKRYDWLVSNVSKAGDEDYQRVYRNFWAMNAARLNQSFCDEYFRKLQAAFTDTPDLGALVRNLYETPTQRSGKHSLQFSFATKLVHMADRHLPIYDSQVASFYSIREPGRHLSFEQRVDEYVKIHAFLGDEYGRVLAEGLLSNSIGRFRALFPESRFTDERVIDSLIWRFVALMRSGAVVDGTMVFG